MLKSKLHYNRSIYNEFFITDNQGANVATYPLSTDYWQGDEDKWIKSFNNGKGQVYVSPIAYDESVQDYSIQVSIPIYDENKNTIGILVSGINLNYVQLSELLTQ